MVSSKDVLDLCLSRQEKETILRMSVVVDFDSILRHASTLKLVPLLKLRRHADEHKRKASADDVCSAAEVHSGESI